MSTLIQIYHDKLETIIQQSDSCQAQSIRLAFQQLLAGYCKNQQLVLIPGLEYHTSGNLPVYLDGTIKDALRLSCGYWENQELDDDLAREVQAKLAKGYPSENILFENAKTAILIQAGQEVERASMADVAQLNALLKRFINYEPPSVKAFRRAIKQFQTVLPLVVQNLRLILAQQAKCNRELQRTFKDLFMLCQTCLNPKISRLEIREMIIQHILAEDLFLTVFNRHGFYWENVVAGQLETVVNSFFTGQLKNNILKSLKNYYAVVCREAAGIVDHHEKQKFLKVIYENFYQTYYALYTDSSTVVYTPHEIARFMIEGTDYLLAKHFNRGLADEQVEILDPATGTGTFITTLIDYLPIHRLRDKYLREIHGNEAAILPYYLAILDIESSYQQKMGEFEAFPHICLVDTLTHSGFEPGCQNQPPAVVFGFAEENVVRIQAQNRRPISVIIAHPPQQSIPKNWKYPAIDAVIKHTYFANHQGQKTKPYEMSVRFFRWASNRLSDNGILALVTDNAFLTAPRFEAFRKTVAKEFNEIYVVDLGGKAKKNQKLPDENVFGIQTGVAISFLVKRQDATPCQIYYVRCPKKMETAADKLSWLKNALFEEMEFLPTGSLLY